MTAQYYTGQKGNRYSVGREVGRGGEGTVYEVKEDLLLVVKIYNEQLAKDKALKLQHMVAMQDADLNKLTAWPLDLVYDSTRQIAGFVMRKLEGFVPLHMLFSPIDRKRLFPDMGYNFLIHVARNLATAFHKIHEAGIVIGDVNEGNILVNANGIISLIDCDSFQVKNGSTYHFCEVGILRYTPPELLNLGTFTEVVRTSNTDSFSLAVLIFQLLFLGRHPFTGVNLTREDIDEEQAIKTMEFAYSLRRQHKKLNPAKNSLELQSFTLGIIDLFHQSFETLNARPSPGEWIQELEVQGRELIVCSRSPLHYYTRQLANCPWCAFTEQSGIVFFLDNAYLHYTSVLNDIEHFINGYKVEQIVLKPLSLPAVKSKVAPTVIPYNLYRYRSAHRLKLFIGFIICLLPAFINPGLALIAILFLLMFSSVSADKKKLANEMNSRLTLQKNMREGLELIQIRYKNPPELAQYKQAANKLTVIVSNFKGLQGAFNTMRKRIEEQHYNRQYHNYLQRFDIRQHTIPAFGAAKKALLYLNGISNAADISKLNRIRIPSIGPKNMQVLMDWQRQMGSTFAYIPDHKTINADIALALEEINEKKRKYEDDIKAEYKIVLSHKLNVIAACEAIERNYGSLAVQLQQADMDMFAFRKFMRFM
jgi:DNA-binding helix-hairpin-helix protein with protein kinase domain